jgi:hypothetical protein
MEGTVYVSIDPIDLATLQQPSAIAVDPSIPKERLDDSLFTSSSRFHTP